MSKKTVLFSLSILTIGTVLKVAGYEPILLDIQTMDDWMNELHK